jgi:hypothetical protein
MIGNSLKDSRYEWSFSHDPYSSLEKKSYFANTIRFAVLDSSGALKWLLADHLVSTSGTMAENGVLG